MESNLENIIQMWKLQGMEEWVTNKQKTRKNSGTVVLSRIQRIKEYAKK